MNTIEKIRFEVERLENYYTSVEWYVEALLAFIDSLSEEPVGKTCKTCGFYENNCPFIRGKFIPYPNKVCKDYTFSTLKAEQEPVSEDLDKKTFDDYLKANPAERRKMKMTEILGEERLAKTKEQMDLEEAARRYVTPPNALGIRTFKAGAEWQKKRWENNRLMAQDKATEEECQREMDFVDNHIKKNHRIPTFSDAINYGIEWQKKQMPMPEDTLIFKKGVEEGRRLEREDVLSLIESRLSQIMGDAQPKPILRAELCNLLVQVKSRDTMTKEEAIYKVLDQRADCLRLILQKRPRERGGYYEGKLHGYEQAMDLLTETLESVSVELLEKEHHDRQE